jgi:Fe-coproporphyrin III synthase
VDVINVCNLRCTHCYWWLNRKDKEQDSITPEDWREIIRKPFEKLHIFVVTLVGGEHTIRPAIIEVLCEEMPRGYV